MHPTIPALAALMLGAALGPASAFAQPGITPAAAVPAAGMRTAGAPAAKSASWAAASSEAASASANSSAGKGDWWAEADSDGDSRLSPAEANANPAVGTNFASIDTDQDGFVTQDEYRVYFTANASQGEGKAAGHSAVVSRNLWLALDTDSDSRISIAEAASDAALSSEFSAIDSNSDGFVVQGEYTLYANAHR
ncbi:hypothetical protein BH11PSE14_BH11PSE14_00420 [soil metagenome]